MDLPLTRRNYIVGLLCDNDEQYVFSYGYEVQQAIKEGFELLIPFPDIDCEYKRNVMLPIFSSRLPDKKRRDIRDILSKYGLQEYDVFKLLRAGGARLPIDSLEFVKIDS